MSLLAACGLLVAQAGCRGGDASAPPKGAIATPDPALTFAPVVYLHPDERYLPLSGNAFVAESRLLFGEDHGCEDHAVASGQRALEHLTEEPVFTVRPFEDLDCRHPSPRSYRADEITRPHENTPAREPGLRPEEGFILDLRNGARRGPAASYLGGRAGVHGAAAWHSTHREEVDGEPGLRVTHWMVYGMHAPRRVNGRPLTTMTHEGDWERVDVMLQGSGRRWKPVAVRIFEPDGRGREIPWADLRRESSEDDPRRTQPVLFAALGTHTLRAHPGDRVEREVDLIGHEALIRDITRGACRTCPRFDTSLPGFSLASQRWYGFGGAWGERGTTTLMTGPLGPRPTDR